VTTRILDAAEVRRLLPMAECVEVVEEALKTLARGDAVLPLRPIVKLPDGSGVLALMPAALGGPACFGLKAISVMPGNHGSEYDAHQGAVLLFEVAHGCLLAVLDASTVTAIRTAAASGVATRCLAREDAGDLAIVGAGVQAASHLDAMRAVRTLRRVRVAARSADSARRFAEHHAARTGLAIEAVADVRAAVEGADLVCTTTSAREPVVHGAWLSPGVHVNAVGACFPTMRELDTEAVRRARLVVDRRESAMKEAGDVLIPIAEGAIGPDHIAGELGEVLIGRVPGRRTADEITLFESLGIAVEDLAAAHHVWRRAEAENAGIAVTLGGRREESHA